MWTTVMVYCFSEEVEWPECGYMATQTDKEIPGNYKPETSITGMYRSKMAKSKHNQTLWKCGWALLIEQWKN